MDQEQAKEWMLEELQAVIAERLYNVRDSDFAVQLKLTSVSDTLATKAAQAALDKLLE